MEVLGLTWTEATSLSLWEVATMMEYLEDKNRKAELRRRDSDRLK